jgi:hypothetical protein
VATTKPETCPKCGGRWGRHCGVLVCDDCGQHYGKDRVRCYCGWAADGGDGRQQLKQGKTLTKA